MLRLAVNELTTYRWSLEEDIRAYQAFDFQGIGVWRQKLSDYGESSGIDLIRESGLEVSSLMWAGGFTGSDGQFHRDSIEDGIDALRLAAELDAACLVAYTGGRGGHTRKHANRLAIAAIEELAYIAEDFGVSLAIEPMHFGCGTGWTFLHSLEEALEFADSIAVPSLKLVLDCYQFGASPRLFELVPAITDRLALVRLADAKQEPDGEQDRCRLGEGIIPLAGIISHLQESGYHGFYEIELIGQSVEHFEYTELLQHSVGFVSETTSLAL